MKGLAAAIRFLTILPVPGRLGGRPEDLAQSAPFFPVVGILLGALAGALAWAAAWCMAPPAVVGAVVVTALLVLSGGLHMDGLCDTADGLLSARPRARALEIMKDSHAGAMGVTAVVCVLLLKFAALASVRAPRMWEAALLMPLAGRCAMVVHMALLPGARADGLGAVFSTRRPYGAAIEAVVVFAGLAWWLLGTVGFAVAGLWLVAVLGLAAYFQRRIGGATGDTFGAVSEVVEIIPALALALWPPGAANGPLFHGS